uniref:RNase H type-1 domain-containing protein n=1 Tax=Cacopsylla melanoneura TaxID=428564 RepID=A0A8D8VSU1_9HEMI
MWCPSHIGIKGNETVDHAAANPTLSLSPLKTSSAQDYNSFINKIIKTRWQNSWNDIPLSNKLKQLKPFVEPWDSSNRNSRIEEVIITRIRIGHTRLTHNHLFTRSPQPICMHLR